MIKDDILSFMREKAYSPMSAEQLMKAFNIDITQYAQFQSVLNKMEDSGHIIKTKKNKYGVPERMDMAVGTLECNKKGFGFLIIDGEDDDIYIAQQDMNGAMNADEVIVKITKKANDSSRREGAVVKIIKRANTKIVGTLECEKNFGFVVADDKKIVQDVYIPHEDLNGAKNGQKVVAKITKWPKPRRNPEGKIIEILGNKGENDTDILSIIRQHDLPEDFNNQVVNEALSVPQRIDEKEIQKRKDLRELLTVTIDGEDAKDLDDAVSLVKIGDKFKLYVHIADVSFYVKEKSNLDKEAYDRGCSVYLIDRVIPMLPKELSNGICSLNPQEDRLTMTVEMLINKHGKVISHNIYESVINSNERMTYTNVYKILEEKDEELKKRYDYLTDMFKKMKDLAEILIQKRKARGSIDFEIPEASIILGEMGDTVDIGLRERNIAHRIIEEFMLVCNETVAEHMFWMNVPFLYRVHEEPDMEKINELNEFIHNLGYHIKGAGSDKIHPKALQELLDTTKGKKEEKLINTLALRSLKRARYSDQCLGHFSLAVQYYTHFTSPIRRYPDLQIHRIIRENIKGSLERRIGHYAEILPEVAEQTSIRERVAEEAERDVEDLKMAQFIKQHIGEEFEGIISGVTSFGIFVELDNLVEGLVRMSNLMDDYYHFDEKNHCLVGENTNKIYRLGDIAKIQVLNVNVENREVDFVLVE